MASVGPDDDNGVNDSGESSPMTVIMAMTVMIMVILVILVILVMLVMLVMMVIMVMNAMVTPDSERRVCPSISKVTRTIERIGGRPGDESLLVFIMMCDEHVVHFIIMMMMYNCTLMLFIS